MARDITQLHPEAQRLALLLVEECKKKGNRKYNTEYAQITRAINKPKRYCKVCGKVLPKRAKSYCSVVCRDKAAYERYIKRMADKSSSSEQLCWTCKKCTGGCSWSHNLTPVEGWVAEETLLRFYSRQKPIPTYRIYQCPLYERGR